MKALLKVVLSVFAGVAVLLVVAVVALLVFIDPNDFKPDIEKAASEQGVALKLEGQLAWQFFPNLGIVVEEISVAPSSEPASVIASIGKAGLSVQVMPLFSGRVAVNGIELDSLEANLSIDKDGKGNWEKITGASDAQEQKTPAKDERSEKFSLGIHVLSITNGQLNYADEQSGQTINLKDFQLKSTDIALNSKPFPLATSGSFTITDASKNSQSGQFDINGHIAVDEAISHVGLSDTRFSLEQKGINGAQSVSGLLQLQAVLPGENRALAVEKLELSEGQALNDDSVAKQKLSVSGLNISLQGMKLDSQLFPLKVSGNITVEQPEMPKVSTQFDFNTMLSVDEKINQIRMEKASLGALLKGDASQKLDLKWTMDVVLEPLSYKGDVHLAPVNARNALAVIGQTLPETQSPKAFGSVGLDANVEGSANAIKASDLKLVLDESTFTGSVAVKDIEKQSIVVNLKGDKLNADDYLAPAAEAPVAQGQAEQAASTSTGDEPLIPVELIQGLDADISFVIGQLVFNTLPFAQMDIVASAHGGKLDISRFNGKLYDGTLQLKAAVDASVDKPVVDFDLDSQQLPVGRVMKDLGIEERFSGASNVKAKGRAKGVSQNELMQTLTGSVDLTGQQMQISSINIEKTVCEYISKVQLKPLTELAWDEFTRLRDMTTHIDIVNGVAMVKNLDAGVEEIALKTNGKYNLVKGDFDFHLTTRIVQAVAGKISCEVTNKSLIDRDIPIRCKGNLDNISFKTCMPDLSMVEDLAKARFEEEKAAAKAKAQAEVDAAKAKAKADAEAALKKKLGDEKSNLLKSLLKK